MGNSGIAFQTKFWGFPIIVEWAHIIVVGLIAFLSTISASNFTITLIVAAVLFSSIFIHELGHAYVCKRVGSRVIELRLIAMGGYVRHHGNLSHPSAFLVILGGPLANVLLIVIANIAISTGIVDSSPYLAFTASQFILWNITLLFFTLLPVFPLDGGQLIHRIISMFYSSSKNGNVVQIKRWKRTPDMITGQIGVIVCYLWIPMVFVVFYFFGFLPLFMLPLELNKSLAKGESKIPT